MYLKASPTKRIWVFKGDGSSQRGAGESHVKETGYPGSSAAGTVPLQALQGRAVPVPPVGLSGEE